MLLLVFLGGFCLFFLLVFFFLGGGLIVYFCEWILFCNLNKEENNAEITVK